MATIDKPTQDHPILSTLLLWLNFLVCAAIAAFLVAALQRGEAMFEQASAHSPRMVETPASAQSVTVDNAERSAIPRAEFETTFADAAESLRAGRFAEAYGRFVALADAGDADAGRIALVMHRYGPEVFGSTWDASTDQIARWTAWSEAAGHRELAHRVPNSGTR